MVLKGELHRLEIVRRLNANQVGTASRDAGLFEASNRGESMNVRFKIWRGDAKAGEFRDYGAECTEGMVVLDAVHQVQATQARDLACRWNCKAGKCGSCSAEVN